MALLSVLVAAYRPTYLDAALSSALAQAHGEVEVVVVDDSAGSAVAGIVGRLGDPRVRYMRNESNQGPAASYARAIAEASGPVLGILNDDDVWEPDLAPQLLQALETWPEAVVAFADHWVLVDGRKDTAASDECSRAWKRDALTPGLHSPFQRLALIDRSVPLAVSALFRRAALDGSGIPEEVGGTYDLFLSYVLSRNGAGAIYVPERLASWRTHRGNLTNEASCARAEEGAAVMRIVVEDRRLAALKPALRDAYGSALWLLATRNLRGGSRRRAASAALASLRQGHVKSALLLPALLLPRRVVSAVAARSIK
jgi:glycosyltransferase involved in cell wall biosynthesis